MQPLLILTVPTEIYSNGFSLGCDIKELVNMELFYLEYGKSPGRLGFVCATIWNLLAWIIYMEFS